MDIANVMYFSQNNNGININNNHISYPIDCKQIKTDHVRKCIESTDCGYMVYKPKKKKKI